MQFILPDFVQFVVSLGLGVGFVIFPVVNHGRIFIAIRCHNNQIHDAVSGQDLSVIFKRERKAAIDMFIVVAVLMSCLAPTVAVTVMEELLSEKYGVLYVWSIAILLINSSMNPVIYLARNSVIRNAVKSTIKLF